MTGVHRTPDGYDGVARTPAIERGGSSDCALLGSRRRYLDCVLSTAFSGRQVMSDQRPTIVGKAKRNLAAQPDCLAHAPKSCAADFVACGPLLC